MSSSSLAINKDAVFEQFVAELKSGGIYNESRHTEGLLHQFLRARKYNLQKSVLMITNCEKWRVDFKVNELVRTFAFPESTRLKKIYPRYFHKVDKVGRPIYIEQLGSVDSKKIFENCTLDRFLQGYVRDSEKTFNYRFPSCSAKTGTLINQSCTILDIKGLPISSILDVKNVLKSVSSISQDNYPESLGKMLIINAPMMFSSVWPMLKAFLDENTAQKINILGSNYHKQLLEVIDAENLPEYYGGKCQCSGGCDNSDTGPWNNGSVTGYPKSEWEDFKIRDSTPAEKSTNNMVVDQRSVSSRDLKMAS